jgi:hypothetical protein
MLSSVMECFMVDDPDDSVADAWSMDEVAARTQAFTDLVLVGEDVKDSEIKVEVLAMLKAVRGTIEKKNASLTPVSNLRDTSRKL